MINNKSEERKATFGERIVSFGERVMRSEERYEHIRSAGHPRAVAFITSLLSVRPSENWADFGPEMHFGKPTRK